MTKKEKVLFIKEYFDRVYADADCTLDYKTPFELMIATILAAQCTDARVNIVTKDLFKKYPDVYAFASADLKELEQDIRSTGFYHNKAKNIIACAQKLISDFSGEVPDTMDELLTLAGVGRKTANLILGDVFGKPAIVVDTHAKRITNLIGLANFAALVCLRSLALLGMTQKCYIFREVCSSLSLGEGWGEAEKNAPPQGTRCAAR